MKQLLSSHLEPQHFTHEHFSLNITPASRELNIIMKMKLPIFHTCDIPMTSALLQSLLPSIFESKCFNDKKYSFTQEVKNTEIGHLFEHIMLEYLCMEKVNQGYMQATFNGVTNWNWREEPRGTFHITINAGWKEKEMILRALEKTISLVTLLLDTVSASNQVYN